MDPPRNNHPNALILNPVQVPQQVPLVFVNPVNNPAVQLQLNPDQQALVTRANNQLIIPNQRVGDNFTTIINMNKLSAFDLTRTAGNYIKNDSSSMNFINESKIENTFSTNIKDQNGITRQ
jgi:hypothetical protein